MSSRRRPGPITPGVCSGGRRRPHRRRREDTEYGSPPSPGRRAQSVLQQRLYSLVELLKRGRAFDHLAIDEEARRRADLQHLMRVFEIVHDLLPGRWIVVDAGLDGLLGGSGLYP